MVKKAQSYDDMMAELQEIVNEFENGNLSLEESMKKYEKSLKIISKLYKDLNTFEGKIKIIDEKYGEVDFKEQ